MIRKRQLGNQSPLRGLHFSIFYHEFPTVTRGYRQTSLRDYIDSFVFAPSVLFCG